MKPVLGSLGPNTLVILTAAEMQLIRARLEGAIHPDAPAAARALNAGILRGTAHITAEFAELQKAKKRGK